LDYGGTGPPILLLHGLAGRATEWSTTAQWLAESFRVIALDQRGHGRSDKAATDFSRSAYVADVVAVIKSLGLAPAILIGQSMGGLNAILTTARHPEVVRGLIVVEAGLSTDAEAPRKIGRWLDSWPLPFPDLESARLFFGGDSLAARTWSEVLVRARDGYRPEFMRETIVASVRDSDDAANYERDWERVSRPALLVVGEYGKVRDEIARMLALNRNAAAPSRAQHTTCI